MKRMTAIVSAVLIVLIAETACRGSGPEIPEIRRGLSAAAREAVSLEIREYEKKLAAAEAGTGPAENVGKFKERISALRSEQDILDRLPPERFPLPGAKTEPAPGLGVPGQPGLILPPEKREIEITVTKGYARGAILEYDGMTRSGPFYHLAGIEGGCLCKLRAGKRYRLTVYLVYRREYFGFIENYYVFAADVKER